MEARSLFAAGKVEQAEALLQSAHKTSPGELSIVMSLGIVTAETGRFWEAKEWFEQALKIDSKCLPALCWLSTVMLKVDRTSEAVRFAEAAVTLDPHNAAAHASLARALVRQGLLAESIAFFQAAARLEPNNAGVLYEWAESLVAAGREREAADVLRRAVLVAPEPVAMIRLAALEMRYGRIDEAERMARRALRKSEGVAQAHAILARILTEQSKSEEAQEHWSRALELSPDAAKIHLEKAAALRAAGQFESAADELDRSIDAKPVQGAAYQTRVYNGRVTEAEMPLVRKMEAALDSKSLNGEELLALTYALGKAYDNLGDYEKAIGYFDRANELNVRLSGLRFDRAALSSDTDAKIRMFTPSAIAEAGRIGIGSQVPIAVVGMMRSGTTFVEQMLTCHPAIGGAGEQRYWGEHDREMVDYDRQTVDRAKLRTYANEYVALLTAIAPGFPHVIDKNPANMQVLGSMHLGMPNSRIIHVLRNPVDTALSIWTTPMNTTAAFVGDRSNIVYAFREFSRLMDHWRQVLPVDRFMEIRYEDLVAEPEKYGRRMVEFCGLEWDEACLHPELNNRRVITPSLWQVRQPIYKSSTERWRKYEPWLGAFEELREVEDVQ